MKISYLIEENNSGYYRIYAEVEGISFESITLRKLDEISKSFKISILELKNLIRKY